MFSVKYYCFVKLFITKGSRGREHAYIEFGTEINWIFPLLSLHEKLNSPNFQFVSLLLCSYNPIIWSCPFQRCMERVMIQNLQIPSTYFLRWFISRFGYICKLINASFQVFLIYFGNSMSTTFCLLRQKKVSSATRSVSGK